MKRILSLILALSLCFAMLSSCNKKDDGEKTPETAPAESSASASAEESGEASAADTSADSADAADYEMDGDAIVAYIGSGTEAVTPASAASIRSDAFSWDMGHGEDLQKVTVTGNIKTIEGNAFAFTAADVIYIEEGVEAIGDGAFSDSYIDEIWFPASVTEIGGYIMETEEGLDGTKIHVVKDSEIAKYFEAEMPYGFCELVYDYQ